MKARLAFGFAVVVAMMAVKANAAEWGTDFAKASADSGKSGKYMVLDFSGSDWCGWCKRLDKEVFSTPEFDAYAKSSLVCVLVDFPRGKKLAPAVKKQNDELAKKQHPAKKAP